MNGVGGNVSGGGRVAGSAGGGSGGGVAGSAGGGVGGEGGGAYLTQRYLATHPDARRVDSFPRSVVLRVLLLEMREYALGAAGGPQHQ